MVELSCNSGCGYERLCPIIEALLLGYPALDLRRRLDLGCAQILSLATWFLLQSPPTYRVAKQIPGRDAAFASLLASRWLLQVPSASASSADMGLKFHVATAVIDIRPKSIGPENYLGLLGVFSLHSISLRSRKYNALSI